MKPVSAAFLAVLIQLFLQASATAETAAALVPLTIESGSGTHAFEVEIADDARERTLGLMYRRTLADDHGMLFDFGEELPASFWMRNTYIPLDMLFIREDGTVESIAERATPLSERSIRSKGPVRYVLEINGGLSDELGIEPGDKVSGPPIGTSQ